MNGGTVVGTPLDVIPYIRGIQIVLTGYSGYTKGKRRDADKLIRDELIRASNRSRTHIQNIHDQSFRDDQLSITQSCRSCIQEIDAFIEDIDKAVTGMDHAFLSGQRSASNSDLKKLIIHDHDTIEMITKAVNISNSGEKTLQDGDYDMTKQLVLQCQQMISSCRGYFGERFTVLNGLRTKKKR